MSVRARSLNERVIWTAIVWTYAFHLLGALYVLIPALGWLLALRSALRGELDDVPTVVLGWAAAALAMLVALLVAHADYDLGLGATAKSTAGWAKGWALLPLFMLIGCGPVRAELLSRAACVLGAQTLGVLALSVGGYLARLPGDLYVSPLSALGGPGPEFFSVELYSIGPENGLPRWRLFTPWGPALGFVGCIYFFLALDEGDRRWRAAGVVGALAMIAASGSRLGVIAVPVAFVLRWMLIDVLRPSLWFAGAGVSLGAGLFGTTFAMLYESALEGFHAARGDSSRVRAMLGRIAVNRWQAEAVLWGHGTVERGPHLVEYMPIGSHHTWYGLLFVKGVVGLAALAAAMLWSLAALLPHARRRASARTALAVLIVLFLYTFGENLEMLTYLIWPGLVALGIAFRDAARDAPRACRPAPGAEAEELAP